MRASALLSLISLVPFVAAVPASETQLILEDITGYADLASSVFGGIAKGIDYAVEEVEKAIFKGDERVEKWIHNGREYIKQHDFTYELVTNPLFSEHSLRVTEPTLCDSSVKQYSGYLDITDGKHLFFWFFESRISPETAPLVLWLNGGPGCSSTTGLLFELGPCRIADEGKNTTRNDYSWNTHANVIFLDQPVGVGYSYSSDGSTVNTSPVAGLDVYAFLELFLQRYPQYADSPFHLAAESYGGTYAPNIASIIYKKNKELALAPTAELIPINLASVILANGLTDPYHQMASVPDYACEGPYPIYDDPEGPQCQALRTRVPTCQRLIKSCYDYNSRLSCVPAALYCWGQLFGPLQQTGLNLYDVRKKCDRQKDGSLCYKQMNWIETWMNDATNKKALGVDPSLDFQSCNMEVNQAFMMQGDGMHNSAALLPDLINDGIRLLVYAGNADAMCNYMGNERWVTALEHNFHSEFVAAKSLPWITTESGRIAGEVRSAGGGGFSAGNVTFVNVHDAGHMVPFDQDEAALDLITKWIMDIPLSLNFTAA
ncbi:serine carboxypeptidase [Neolentinus lepideus HHB14362 ss-1]|uniref:Carboxypeptidase n=1 Tax=Neolentinus lepideus HHB14362 ss-1 TaxID=1314782 RepID=A0A165U4Z1_9AGAM|nr:serine carboxypeptidase [Neolentinus lepideus HHB14362 ss-1]